MSTPPIPHSRPCMGEAEAAAAAEVVRSGWLKGGSRRAELEAVIGRDQGFSHVLATPSCTQALHLLLRARFPAGGARVALPAYVCRSVWDAITLARCVPVLVDSEWETLAPNLDAVRAARPDAVVVAHLAGVRAPVEPFLGQGWLVIEDCAQRIESLDRPARPDPDHARLYSFEATKVITCGEGGALAVQSAELFEAARRLRDGDVLGVAAGLWLPFTDVQAAVARVQWARLPEFAQRRQEHIALLKSFIPPGRWHPAMHQPNPAPFRFLLVGEAGEGWSDTQGVAYRRPVAHGSLARCLPVPDPNRFPVADRLGRTLWSVPCQPALTAAQVEQVGRITRDHLAALARGPHNSLGDRS